MKMISTIFKITMWRSKKIIVGEYGKDFFKKFRSMSRAHLKKIVPLVPNIGDSIFLFNYEFCPSYISWYKAYLELGLDSDTANSLIWKMNEALVKTIPKLLMKMSVKRYIGGFEKKAAKHEKLSKENKVHPYDWKIYYRPINDTTFEIDIYECGMIKVCRDFDALGLFPMMCRMDYLFSHYMGNGFERTKTLGDGNDCCNCRYILEGTCEWSPEKGFENRK